MVHHSIHNEITDVYTVEKIMNKMKKTHKFYYHTVMFIDLKHLVYIDNNNKLLTEHAKYF